MKKSILTNAAKLVEFLRSVNLLDSAAHDDLCGLDGQGDTQILACNTTIIDLRTEHKKARRRP